MARVNHQRPDFRAFHRSIAAELKSAKNRVRNLIQGRHWQTDGEHKEAVLRSVIRRHLPSSMTMGTGFVVAKDDASTQIDILIIDGGAPVLFREGDVMIVTPDAVRAVIEVKTRLQGAEYTEALEKLGRIARICDGYRGSQIWTGLFVYDTQDIDDRAVLSAVACCARDTGGRVNCLSCGQSWFCRYWSNSEGTPQPMAEVFWRSYELRSLAPSYFIGNLMAALASTGGHDHQYAWYPEIGGKEAHKLYQIPAGGDEPEQC